MVSDEVFREWLVFCIVSKHCEAEVYVCVVNEGVVIMAVGGDVPFAVCVRRSDCSAGGVTQERAMVDLSNDALERMPLRSKDNYYPCIPVNMFVSTLTESVVAILDLLRSQIQEVLVG